jgi:hypothetical protein
MVYGREAVLPIETKYPTWRTLGWNDVHTRAELIAVRARQIEMRDEDMEEAMLRKTRIRQAGQERFDATHQIRQTPLKPKDLVLKHDTFNVDIDKSRSKKLNWRWLGPYVISKADQLKGTYSLSELDGTELAGTYSGNRLKKFVQRERYFYPVDGELERESEREERAVDENEGLQEEAVPDEEDEEEGVTDEREGLIGWNNRNGDNEVEVVVRAPTLSRAERRKYVRFEEDWE